MTLTVSKVSNLIDLSPVNTSDDDYPTIAKTLAKKIHLDKLNYNLKSIGVSICASGQGICMAVNKYSQIRGATVIEIRQMQNIVKHNFANVLCLSQLYTTPDVAIESINLFIKENSKYDTVESLDLRHIRRVNEMENTEQL